MNLISNGLFNGFNSAPNFLILDDFGGAISLQYQMTAQKLLFDDITNFNKRSDYLELGLNLNAKGSIYHRNLIYFDIDLNIIGFSQKDQDLYFSDSSINDSTKNNYNIRVNFLREKKINLQFFALKYYSSYHRRLEERNFTNSSETGISIYGNTKIFPFSLIVSRIRNKYETLALVSRNEDIGNIKLSVNLLPMKNVRSFFKFLNKDYTESVFGTKYNSTQMQADFFLPYGAGKMSRFSLRSFFNKMAGDIEYENLRFSLASKHFLLRKLALKTNIDLDSNLNSGGRTNRRSLMSSIEHKLFESLFTSLAGEIESISSDHQNYTIFGTGGIVNYNKKIKNGLVSLSFTKWFKWGEYTSKSDIVYQSEIYDFSISDFIILNTTGIKIESIEITDQDLSILYLEGFDYAIDFNGMQVIITRLPGGAISPGSKVRISYQNLSFPDFSMRNNPHQLFLTLNFFKYFSAFYKNTSSTYSISSEFLIPPFVDSNVDSYGVKVISEMLSGEYFNERNESSSGVYNSKNYRLSFNLNPFKIIRLGFHLTGNRIEYEDAGLVSTDFRSFIAELNFNPSHNVNFRTYYRKLNYSNQNSEWLRESLIIKLQWNLRKIIVDLFYEHFLNKSGFSDRSNNYLVLKIRRIF